FNEIESSDEQPSNYLHCPSGSICSDKSAVGFTSHMSSVDSSLFIDSSLHSSTETFSHLASNEEENYLTGSSNSLYFSECDSGNCEAISDFNSFSPASPSEPNPSSLISNNCLVRVNNSDSNNNLSFWNGSDDA